MIYYSFLLFVNKPIVKKYVKFQLQKKLRERVKNIYLNKILFCLLFVFGYLFELKFKLNFNECLYYYTLCLNNNNLTKNDRLFYVLIYWVNKKSSVNNTLNYNSDNNFR